MADQNNDEEKPSEEKSTEVKLTDEPETPIESSEKPKDEFEDITEPSVTNEVAKETENSLETVKNQPIVQKFIEGEVIIDQENPFRKSGIVRSSLSKNKIKTKTKTVTIDETDYITKEEILKQSKYVPVYVKNPDKYLTYTKAAPDGEKSIPKPVRRTPIPAPRKVIPKPREAKIRKTDPRYPNLSDIKVSF